MQLKGLLHHMTQSIQTESSSSENFAQLFESSVERVDQLKEGDVVNGTVIKVNDNTIIVDIGYKSEGVIAVSEFTTTNGAVQVQPGDIVEVLIEAKEDDDGLVSLSKEKADRLKVWDEISEACERNELVEGTITSRVKGGLAVTIRGGVKAFLPGSQVDLRPVRNLDKMLGQTYPFKVIKFNKKRGNIVLSRRALLEEERSELKQQTLENLQEGQVVEGIIKNITEYGAFVDLGGIDGLLHITDMSWGRVTHPNEMFNMGDRVTVKVLKYNADTERVSLGLKQTTDDPWQNATVSYPAGKKVQGKVVSLTDYGAFVEMDEGIEGLIHVSEMSWSKPKHPSKILEVGQDVECVVLDIDAQNKRISLGLKQLEPDPWSRFVQSYNPGDIIRGKVRSITDYGVFIGIEDGVDGMVHKSDLSWSDRITNPAEIYQKGDEVEAIILSINHDENRVSLGIKQLYEDPWSYASDRYAIGTILEVRLVEFDKNGCFVELERGLEGFVEDIEFTQAVRDIESKSEVGAILKSEIISLDSHGRKITLSFKDLEDREINFDPSKTAGLSENKRRIGPSGKLSATTLGDVLKDKLSGLSINDETKEQEEDSEASSDDTTASQA